MKLASKTPSSTLASNHLMMPSFFDNDVWPVKALGLQPDYSQSCYYLNFSKIIQPWFKQAIKKFVQLQSASKSYASCRSYIIGLAHFSRFLAQVDADCSPESISREHIIRYLGYLSTSNLSDSTKKVALVHLRTFHECCLQEAWLSLPMTPLIHQGDLSGKIETMPKYIPEMVVAQLEQHLPQLPEYRQRLIVLLLETGRRVSEICALAFDCLDTDKENDYFLKVVDKKLKKSYLIPISEKSHNLIKAQQAFALTINKETNYLFPPCHPCKSPHMTARHINYSLNILAEQCRIVDENGKIWHFHAHQFRHTVGTRMINAGISQTLVQRFLGHESPEMTSRYAHIHQETLKTAFQKFNEKLIDVNGESYRIDNTSDAQWLKHNIMAQSLPNGLCTLPATQHHCPHANACLSCTHFRTDKRFIKQHKAQLTQTKLLIQSAQQQGWHRQLEMNQTVEKHLVHMIDALESQDE